MNYLDYIKKQWYNVQINKVKIQQNKYLKGDGMDIERINPYIRYVGVHTIDYNNRATKLCYDCRLFHVEKGNGAIVVNGKKYKFSNNTTIVLPYGSVYSFKYTESDIKIYVINFDFTEEFSYIKESLGTPRYHEHIKEKIVKCPYPDEFTEIAVKEKVNIVAYLEKIRDLFMIQKPFYKETASAYLKLCLMEFINKNPDNKSSTLANDVMKYVYENYSSPDLTNNHIAEVFGYHPYYLNNIIKTETGKTLHQQIVDYRLSVATNYLVASEMDVNTISWKSGFGTVSYFIKTFKEKMGTTPHRYRKEHSDF